MKEVGHTGFLLDAKVMAAILYHYLTDDGFKKTVHMEHKTMAGLFNNYLDALKDAYKEEVSYHEQLMSATSKYINII